MVQLIVEDQAYPEVYGQDGSYKAYEAPLSATLEMISGRIVEEQRGDVYYAEYSVKYLDDNLLRHCLTNIRNKKSFTATIMVPPNTMVTSVFRCTSFTHPGYLMQVGDTPYWTNLSFTLREVDPHD